MTSTKQGSVFSPCVRNCCLDVNDICLGCFRSLTEITSWLKVDEITRQQYLQNAKKREAQRYAKQRYSPIFKPNESLPPEHFE